MLGEASSAIEPTMRLRARLSRRRQLASSPSGTLRSLADSSLGGDATFTHAAASRDDLGWTVSLSHSPCEFPFTQPPQPALAHSSRRRPLAPARTSN